ncbi:MAG: 3-keto-5-aminohexanoate cleavage protein [Aestuariivita sp.]|nr:3-keto-5-aminohexanoate cleavage protein [Aestuariivita sp.]MCY4203806.1 3-keto-5-aminohexanoate cleavage protein [Aestuariivita sp.]
MAQKTILTCAVTGNGTMPSQNENLPVTPVEIAHAAIDAGKAGAAIAHIHVRDPDTAKGSMNIALYREVVSRIRDADSDIIINLTTGEGQRFVPSAQDPKVAAPGTTLTHPKLRVAHVAELKPELCTLDFNTMVNKTWTVINTPSSLKTMLNIVNDTGTKPEIEIFDSGDLNMAKDFIQRGFFKRPVMCQFVMGINFGAAANTQTMAYLVSQLPDDCIWAAFGIGRMAFPMLAQSFLLGGHVRIGMEDTVYIEKGKLAKSNAQLVEKSISIVENLGGTMATASEARDMLGLNP